MDNKTITIADAVERMITAINIVTGDDTQITRSCENFLELLKMKKKIQLCKATKVLRLKICKLPEAYQSPARCRAGLTVYLPKNARLAASYKRSLVQCVMTVMH